jgi:uncharacterized membrane protein YbhN (UPF0104 family)
MPEATHGGKRAATPRGRLLRGLKLALLCALLGYVLWSLRSQTDALAGLLAPGYLPHLAAAALCLTVNQLLMAYRQVVLLRHAGAPVPLGESARIIFAGLFANNLMPAGMGHDLTRMVYLRGYGGQTGASLGGLVILDRFLGLMGLSVLALCSFGALTRFYPAAVPGEAGRLLLYAVLAPLPLGLVILALRHGATFDLVSRLCGRLPLGGKLQELLAGMRRFASRKRVLLWALILAALGHLSTVLGVAFIAAGLYGERAALGSTLVSPLVFFASSVPVTPSNLGWTETVADAAWSVFGLRGGLVIFLVWRLVTMLVSLAGCAAYLNLRGQAARGGES